MGKAAEILGVTRIHLYRVLTGERKGRPGLKRSYYAMKGALAAK